MNKKIIALFVIVLGVAIGSTYFIAKRQMVSGVPQNLPHYHEADLAPFDGSNADKPIYIGLDGYVYDVSKGKEYYITGGSYHYLAGRDSSKELDLIGGEIIKREYPVVGVLAK